MNIIIAGNFEFASSSANALRVRGIANALQLEGHSLSVLENRVSGPDAESHVASVPANSSVFSVDEYGKGLFARLPASMRGLFMGDVSVARIRSEGWVPDCIIVSGSHLGYLLRFRRLCNELRIPLVLDIVEWYQPEDLPGGRFGPYAIANEISMRYTTRRADGVIVLSQRLERHYRLGGAKVIDIPPLFEPVLAPAHKWSDSDGRLHLSYAGSPGRKEALGLVLTSLQRLDERGVDFLLHAVGLSALDLVTVPEAAGLSVCNPARDRIRFYGRVPNARAREIVAASNFTLLLRPLRKANQFGFPSKLAESMAVGTPAIANDFSDLSLHLTNDDNALFLPELDGDAVLDVLVRAGAMSPSRRRRMAERALATARERFSPAAASGRLSQFLGSLS